jgi:hypothetical protein
MINKLLDDVYKNNVCLITVKNCPERVLFLN